MTISSLLGLLFFLLFAAFGIFLEYRLIQRQRDRLNNIHDKLLALLDSIDESLVDIAYCLHRPSDS